MDKDIKYQGAILMGNAETSSRDGKGYWVVVEPEGAQLESERLFSEYTFITATAMRMKYGNKEKELILKELEGYTFSKAKARLALGMYEPQREYKQEINTATLKEEVKPINDTLIQRYLLKGLLNIRKQNPTNYQYEELDVEGLCSILAIPKKQYLYNVTILLEDGLIEECEIDGIDYTNGGVFIRSSGVKYLESIKVEEREQTKEIGITQTIEGIKEHEYDIVLSFAGEDREFAEKLAIELKNRGIKVFYDAFEQDELWGKNLYDYLSYIYSKAARYCIMLLSKNYASKTWTNHERKNAQARAFREKNEYILPIRIDDTEIPGLPETVGYISSQNISISKIADLAYKKLVKLS